MAGHKNTHESAAQGGGGGGVSHVTLDAREALRRAAPGEPTGDGSFTHRAVTSDKAALDAVIARAEALGIGPSAVDAMRADPRVARQYERWSDFVAEIPGEDDFRLQKYPQGPPYPAIEPSAGWLRCFAQQVRAGPLALPAAAWCASCVLWAPRVVCVCVSSQS
jgi:hypothetical protein